MNHKSEMFERFKRFQSEVKDHRDKKMKCLRYDRGGEYLSYEFGMQFKTICENCFHSSRLLEHHSVMVCPNVVVVLYWI